MKFNADRSTDIQSMQAVILAGGYGTRLSEETSDKPKPMVEIGGLPILWHIMKGFSAFGVKKFVIAAGYRAEVIKHFFVSYNYRSQDLKIDLLNNEIVVNEKNRDDWIIQVIDTGRDVETGARLYRLKHLLEGERFFFTYGDGVCDVNLYDLVKFHESASSIATLTAVRPPARFGSLELEEDKVSRFAEKSQASEGWINGGFFVLEPQIFDYLEDSVSCVFESSPLEKLASKSALAAFRHEGFWQCMDTLRDLRLLRTLWEQETPPWKVW